jgi:UDP-glucuronate 4-epimerase
MPFSEHHGVDHPVSLYASTKRAGELMAHNYAELFGLPVTALRFFTVYGPWGRPDMSPMIFATRMSRGEPIEVFNHGKHRRDFTFVSDIVEGVVRALAQPPSANPGWDSLTADPATSRAPFRVHNIGNSSTVELMYFIELLEKALGVTAVKHFLPAQPGDVFETLADVTELETAIGYRPKVAIEEGVERFIQWFRSSANPL